MDNNNKKPSTSTTQSTGTGSEKEKEIRQQQQQKSAGRENMSTQRTARDAKDDLSNCRDRE